MIIKRLTAVCRSVLFVLVSIRSGVKGKAQTCAGWETGTAGVRKVERVQTITARDRDRNSISQSNSNSQTKTNNSKPKAKTTAQKKSKQQPPHQKNMVFLAHTRAAKASSTLNPNICDKNLLSLQKITL